MVKQLADILVERGLVDEAQLAAAYDEHQRAGRSLGRVLVDQGVLTEAQLVEALASQIGLQFVDLAEYNVDGSAVARVSPAVCRRHTVLPIGYVDGRLVLAMADPGNVFALDDLTSALSHDDEEEDLARLKEVVDDAPIVKYVNLLITQAIQDRASDIHIEPGEHDLRVRYRIDGVLHEVMRSPRSIQSGVISRLKIMSDINIAERRIPQDGRLSVTAHGQKVDLRVATLPTVWGEKVVMRILDNSTATLALSDLGFEESNYTRYSASFTKPYGMILVTGPTGSGKSTTLYAALNIIAKPEINVITVEDPVEYRLPGINQVQVNAKAGLSFAAALRSILRSDPDVVLIGEIRDHETALIAVEAALTGHLVLSTLHTNDAASAITRLTEMGIEPFPVGSALDCVLAQRLARRLCPKCKETYQPTAEELLSAGFPWTPGEQLPSLPGGRGSTLPPSGTPSRSRTCRTFRFSGFSGFSGLCGWCGHDGYGGWCGHDYAGPDAADRFGRSVHGRLPAADHRAADPAGRRGPRPGAGAGAGDRGLRPAPDGVQPAAAADQR